MTTSLTAPGRSIYLVHSTVTTREGLSLLAGADGFVVVGSAQQLVDASAEIEQLKPQVLICGNQGATAECVNRLRQSSPETRIFLMVDRLDQLALNEYIQWNVHGLCSSDVSGSLLFDAVNGPAAGLWLDDDAMRLMRARFQQLVETPTEPMSTIKAFTERELAILDMLVQGATNNRIASQLGISVETVKTYIRRVMDKSGIRNRAALVAHYRTTAKRPS